jgi:HSF-type DNA-binding
MVSAAAASAQQSGRAFSVIPPFAGPSNSSSYLFLSPFPFFSLGAFNSCFRQTKFASFQRQLNLYGFRRITQGRDKGGYYHELFLRGRTLLALKMQRTKVKGTGARKASSPETEPDFYTMPFVYERGGKKSAAASPTASQPTAAAAPPSPNMSSPVLQDRPFPTVSSDLRKMSPPSYTTVKPVGGTLSRASLLGVSNGPGALLPPSGFASFQNNLSRREIMAQMIASSSRIHSLRESLTANAVGSSLNDRSSLLGESSLLPYTPTQRGPLHLNALNMPCNCALPAF